MYFPNKGMTHTNRKRKQFIQAFCALYSTKCLNININGSLEPYFIDLIQK